MPVLVHLFAGLADEIGTTSLSFPLSGKEECTVGSLKAELTRKHPGAERLVRQSLTSVNRSYAPDDRLLQDGDELSLIPPLSGG
ncbi:MoaD/ThiS family protein [Gorillibacterium sp. CAU 1737]|uniref:MoaD/ThiS family protein n=1 Tax=Gorillibacterium sp. CAU 1737 TaxID=3140362 RepID=UPI00326023F5